MHMQAVGCYIQRAELFNATRIKFRLHHFCPICPMHPRTVHFHNLDILRFIAAFIIVIAHGYEAWLGWGHTHPFLAGSNGEEFSTAGGWVHGIIKNFTIGVDVFFVISGFLITYLLLEEKAQSGKISFAKFYLRRTLRIWPLYFLLVALGPLIFHWNDYYYFLETKSHISTQADYLTTALMVNNFWAIQEQNWVFPFAHFWSICIEEHFYIVWPFIIAFIPIKKLPWVFGAIILLSMMMRAYFQMIHPHPFWHNYLHTLCRMDMLAIGGLIAYIHHLKPIALNIHWGIRTAVYTLFIVVMINVGWQPVDGSIISQVFTKYLFGAFFIFWMMNYLFNQKAWLSFKRKNFIHYLGKTSYGLYMYHNILVSFVILMVVQPNDFADHEWWKFWLIYIGSTILISALSYEFFEKYFLKWKDKFAVILTRR